MALLPKVKLKALVSFPANVTDGIGIDVVKENGNYHFDLAFDDFAPPITGLTDPTHQTLLVWNSLTDSYVLAPVSLFGVGVGTGDVVGPAEAIDNNIAAFDTTTGKLIKDSGIAISSIGSGAASGITFTPVGDIAATNVQAAIAELDTEKVDIDGDTMTGALTLSGAPTDPLHAATKAYVDAAAGGGGDVMGPVSSTIDNIAVFADGTGNVIKDGGVTVAGLQPIDAELTALAGLTSAVNQVPIFTGSGTASTITVSAAAQTVLDDASVGAMLTTLGGQPLDAELSAIAGLTSAADQVPYFTGSGTAALMTVTAAARTVLDETTTALMLTALGGEPTDADLTAIAALSTTGIARRTAVTPTWAVGGAVTNAELDVMNAFTLKANATGGSAIPTDVSIPALTEKTTPAGGDWLLMVDITASNALKKVAFSNLPGASGGITEAPNDGQKYGRQSLGWSVIGAGTGDVTAAANFATDNVVIRSDGVLKGVQFSGRVLDDSNNQFVPAGAGDVVGHTALLSIGGNIDTHEQFGTNAATGGMAIGMFSATAGTAGHFDFYRSKSGTLAAATVVASGDALGAVNWYGAQQTGTFATQTMAAQIRAEVDGTVTSGGTGDMPGRIVLGTTADGGASVTDRLILDSAGILKPNANDGVALGTTALSFSDLFLADGAVINYGAGGVTETHTAASDSLTLALDAGNTLASTLFNVAIDGATRFILSATALTPGANDGIALGSTTVGFADLHLATGGVINWANGEITLTETDANTLTFAGGVLVVPNTGLQVGASIPFSDSAGTLTLQNVDALDATTETTIEGAIDTLGGLTSIQGFNFTLGTDPGFDVLFGWDDSANAGAGAYKNLLVADLTLEGAPATGDFIVLYGAEGDVRKVNWSAIPVLASLATTTEVLTGTDAAKTVTPDALAALWEKGTSASPSAGLLTLGEGGYFHITGSGTISDIDFTTASRDGRFAMLVFDAAFTLQHNATSLILPSGANITTAAGDSCIVVQDASDNVKVVAYERAAGTALVAGGGTPTAITVVAEAAETTAFIGFFINATGDMGPKTHTNLLFNAATGALGTTTLDLGASGATDTTLSRVSAGDIQIEDKIVYRAGGTDVPLLDGGTGASTAVVALQNLAVHQFHLVNGKITESHTGNAATFAIKGLDGNDPSSTNPVLCIFGDGTQRAITAANSIVVSSGSTLGATSGVAFRVWLALVDDAGTLRLAVRNCSDATGVYGFPGNGILTSTAEGGAGAADSAGVTYTGTAVSAKQFVVVAFAEFDSGLATAGTWSSSPTRIANYIRGMPLPGRVIQSVRLDDGAVASGTTVLPEDITIPQSGEGTQFMSLAITPTHAANHLSIAFSGVFASSTAASVCTALFQDSTANALRAAFTTADATNTNWPMYLALRHRMRAATTSATTFKLRAGQGTAGTVTFNGYGGTLVYGGVMNSFLEIVEVMG